jgi:hypothetical protein
MSSHMRGLHCVISCSRVQRQEGSRKISNINGGFETMENLSQGEIRGTSSGADSFVDLLFSAGVPCRTESQFIPIDGFAGIGHICHAG